MQTTIPAFSMWSLLGGCSDPWQAGTWIESDFEVQDDPCEWASDIFESEEPNQYTLGEAPAPVPDDADNDILEIEHESFDDAREWIQAQSDDFWSYCYRPDHNYRSPLEVECPVIIQLVQSSLILEPPVTGACDVDDISFYSSTNGILVREGEALMNHSIEFFLPSRCGSWTAADPEGSPSCSMIYSSWLKRE